jgi:hypothetical protein
MIPLQLCPPHGRREGVISVLIPSRGRPSMLILAVKSLRNTAAHPELLEILIAYDPDDIATRSAADALSADVSWEAPERYGYAHFSRYCAELLGWATGEWLLPAWTDDVIMQVKGWDDLLRAQPAGSIAAFEDNYAGPETCFLAVHADALAAIGRLSPLPSLDTWFEYAGRDAGVLVHPGITVFHDRPDITGCAPDTTYAEGGGAWRAGGSGGDLFHHEPYLTWRAEDAAALRRLREEVIR